MVGADPEPRRTAHGPGEAKAALDGALQRPAYRGQRVERHVGRAGGGRGHAARRWRSRRGRDEFEKLDGSYKEVWKVTGVSETGELRGTIELNTVTRRGS